MRIQMIVAAGVAALACGGAAPPPDQTDRFERQVLAQVNFAREHPRELAEALRAYRATFHGNIVYEDDEPVGVLTEEGVAAVDDAIAFLERQHPLPALDRGALLAEAARDHVVEQGPTGAIGHASPRGQSPGDRVRARGGDVYVSETISYGKTTAESVVRQLVVDDGLPRRGHRVLVFSTAYRYAGVGCGTHARYGYMCVIDYSGTPTGGPMPPSIAS